MKCFFNNKSPFFRIPSTLDLLQKGLHRSIRSCTTTGEALPELAQTAMLQMSLATLNDLPIAYRFGVIPGKFFIELINSLLEEYEKYSFGHICHIATQCNQINQGVEICDWMGFVEPHKMRWPEVATSTRNDYILFNRTMAGQFSRFQWAAPNWRARVKLNKTSNTDARNTQ